jgi:hypothetical protein
MSQQDSDRPLKVYTRPQLQVYGDLREITRTVAGASPRTDKPGSGPNRTF